MHRAVLFFFHFIFCFILFPSDVGYYEVDGSNVCTFDKSSGLTPTRMPPICPAGTTYRRTKGFVHLYLVKL